MHLRATFALILALTTPANANGHWPAPGDVITPWTGGLGHVGGDGSARDGLPFGTGFQDTMHTLLAIYGHNISIGFPQECGAGPLVSARIPGRVDLTFQDDRLVGWMLIGDADLRLESGLRVGSRRDALSGLPDLVFYESGLGTEFAAGDLFGLLAEDANTVRAIWAGTNCIFR